MHTVDMGDGTKVMTGVEVDFAMIFSRGMVEMKRHLLQADAECWTAQDKLDRIVNPLMKKTSEKLEAAKGGAPYDINDWSVDPE